MPDLKINLGAGSVLQPGFCNHDLVPLDGIDVVHDLDQFPWPWEDGAASRIRAFDVFEHVWHPLPFIRECWRVLRPGGVLDIHTVHWRSPNYHMDPDHKRGLELGSFDYWVPGTQLHERYGAAYTGGYATFAYVEPPKLVDGMEIAVLLRKLAA